MLRSLLQVFSERGSVLELTHVPVQSDCDRVALASKRYAALMKHGRQFRCDVVKKRETPPSHALLAIQERVAGEQARDGAKVHPFNKPKRGKQ